MTCGPLLVEADRLLRELFPCAYLAETAIGERDEFLLRFVHPIPYDRLGAFVEALKGLRPMAKNAPKAPSKAPLFTKADLPKNRSSAPPAKGGKAPPPASKGKGSK
jgi:hypothetical protein